LAEKVPTGFDSICITKICNHDQLETIAIYNFERSNFIGESDPNIEGEKYASDYQIAVGKEKNVELVYVFCSDVPIHVQILFLA